MNEVRVEVLIVGAGYVPSSIRSGRRCLQWRWKLHLSQPGGRSFTFLIPPIRPGLCWVRKEPHCFSSAPMDIWLLEA